MLPGLGLISERLERLRGRLILFAPVMLGIGIGVNFSLGQEPGVFVLAALCLSAMGAILIGRHVGHGALPGFGLLFLALATVIAGVVLASVRTGAVAAPVLGFRYYGPVEGRVVLIDRSQSDAVRLTLDHVRLKRVGSDRTPRRVRVSLHGEQGFVDPSPDMRIAVTAHLSPPQGPVEPGGFDFRRMSWFRGIGAVGYARTPAVVLDPPGKALPVERLRRAISGAVQRHIPGEAGAFAAAITTGDRSAMGSETLEALRASNLAHLLAISGLHMGLLVGFVFGSLRLGLALVPGVGQAIDVRRVAAVFALIAGAFYLALSGGAVSTSRAFVMVAVMLGAIIAGRRALTLRAVAVAALILLIFKPESLVEAGFQMSFAATTALVAVFGSVKGFQGNRLPRWARPVFAVVLSSLVAGLATAPFAAAIFNRVAHYGLLANVLAVPVMGTLVMPLAVVAAILAPFGLDGVAFSVMRWPIEWILSVARHVAALDGSVGHVVAPQAYVIPTIALGGLTVVLTRGGARVAGAATILAALVAWTQAERPGVLISESGRLVGVLGPVGRVLNKDRGDGFAATSWLENDGDGADQDTAARRVGFLGPKDSQTGSANGLRITVLTGRDPEERVRDACVTSDLVVLPAKPYVAEASCLVLDQERLRRTGSLAIYTEGGAPRIVTAAQLSGDRPWTRQRGAPDLISLSPNETGRTREDTPDVFPGVIADQ